MNYNNKINNYCKTYPNNTVNSNHLYMNKSNNDKEVKNSYKSISNSIGNNIDLDKICKNKIDIINNIDATKSLNKSEESEYEIMIFKKFPKIKKVFQETMKDPNISQHDKSTLWFAVGCLESELEEPETYGLPKDFKLNNYDDLKSLINNDIKNNKSVASIFPQYSKDLLDLAKMDEFLLEKVKEIDKEIENDTNNGILITRY